MHKCKCKFFLCVCRSLLSLPLAKPRITHCRERNPNNLRTLPMSTNTVLSFSIGLWNCQSAVNKADLITSITSHSRLNLMVLTETWIKPEDNATPAALSNNFSFSHTPRLTGRGGGTGLLISNNWKFTPLSSSSINSSFESHSVTITYPLKIHFVVVYHPPGPLVNFVEEFDLLLSTFPEDGTPLVIFGDFNIQLDKPQAADFHTLLASFDLKRVSTTATHKSGNQLDLIYIRYCSTDHVLVTPLHTSDHFLLTLNLNMIPDTSHTPPHVTFRRNLRSLSPSRLSAMVSSSLPPLKQLSYLDANSATDTFCSTLMSCFDTFCPLTSRPARTTPSAPWLSVVLREHRSKLRAAERVWRKSQNPTDLNFYRSLLSDFSANVSTAKRTYYHDKINNSPNSRMLFKTFSSLLCPPPPSPSSTLTADHFGTFFINKITNLTAQISTPQSVKHILPANINSFTYFSPLSEAEISKLILSSHPTTCTLDPIPSHLLQAISPAVVPALTHIVNTSLHTGIVSSAFKQARITPLLKKPTLNPTLLGNYRPVSLLPFIAKTLERVVFNQVSAFSHRTTSWTVTNLASEVDIPPKLPCSLLLKI